MANDTYKWTDNPTVSGVSICDTDILNDCLMHLKYDKKDGKGGFGLFDMKIADHILTGDEAIGWALQGSAVTMTYPDAVNKIKELYANGLDETYRGIGCKKSIDGRYIADISQSAAIDELYVKTGIVDFYILDQVNNMFYLPKSKYFSQYTVDSALVNNYNEPGLPDHSHTYTTKNSSLPQAGSTTWVWVGEKQEQSGLASESNDIYGKSETVQPPSSNKLLYYRVGETVVNSDKALIEAEGLYNKTRQEIAEQTQDCLSRIQAEGSPLSRSHISNCVAEAPNGIALFTGNTITVKQGLKVLIPNGRNTDGTLKNLVYTVAADIIYTEASNSAGEYPFMLKADGTIFPIEKLYIQDAQPSSNIQNQYWFNPSENTMYTINADNVWSEVLCTVIGTQIRLEDNNISGFIPKKPLSLLKRDDKSEILSWSAPDYSRILSGVGNNYTAPTDGIYAFAIGNNNTSRSIYVNGVELFMLINSYGTTGGHFVPLAKGDVIYISAQSAGLTSSYFIPLKGAN